MRLLEGKVFEKKMMLFKPKFLLFALIDINYQALDMVRLSVFIPFGGFTESDYPDDLVSFRDQSEFPFEGERARGSEMMNEISL